MNLKLKEGTKLERNIHVNLKKNYRLFLKVLKVQLKMRYQKNKYLKKKEIIIKEGQKTASSASSEDKYVEPKKVGGKKTSGTLTPKIQFSFV